MFIMLLVLISMLPIILSILHTSFLNPFSKKNICNNKDTIMEKLNPNGLLLYIFFNKKGTFFVWKESLYENVKKYIEKSIN